MTAEIAILNRSAVALAADSAVTLGVRGQQKIYNSVDKLFHLTLKEPVGIMIFGGAEYMGVPIETVIKKFRSSPFSEARKTLKEYSAAFFDFLEREITVPPKVSEQNTSEILTSVFVEIRYQAFANYFEAATADKKPKGFAHSTYLQTRIAQLINERIAQLEKKPDNPLIIANPDDAWCATLVEKIIKETFLPDEMRKPAFDLACLLLRKDSYSNGAMGLVFAGFGTDELFPKLQAFHSDGLINGRVKRQEFQYVDIKRTGDGAGARIEAFAQKEMVHRFLDGIDPDFEGYLRSAMNEALNDMGKEVLNSFVRTSRKNKKLIAEKIADAAERYLEDFATKADDRKETNFRQKILDMVNFMPKSDLANMAESLINLTSTKRRVSAESETVGGPIDVAVISKYDGFVWIKRKHYFDKELNPRYFASQLKR